MACGQTSRYFLSMEKEFKEQLRGADGQSRHVIVVFLDVRGFSSFARIAESTDTAEFLKSAYLKILDQFFPDAEFVKPTGDGLLVIYGYDRETLTEAIREAVDRSVSLVEAFPTICAEDPMVNFTVPERLGIGLSRGSATALVAGETPLDFSGRPLNLASRLMDLARPSGVVFDESFGYELLTEEMQQRFSAEPAFVKGIAESEPLNVYVLTGYTRIPDYNKRPMGNFVRFTEEAESVAFSEFCERAPVFRHSMTHEAARSDDIELHIGYPATRSNGSKHPKLRVYTKAPGKFERAAGKIYASVDYTPFVQSMKRDGVKGPWEIGLTLEYSVVAESAEPKGDNAANDASSARDGDG
jgi:class 3 adenylate cyclase